MFANLSAIENEAYGKIMACVQSVSGEQQQTLDENRKLRKDFCAIIKLLPNAYHRNIWDTNSLSLETQLLGKTLKQRHSESDSENIGHRAGRK
ncbi:GL22379 [Drosophila persimilis]|uniref:GL22379 n=1 Tax=Drosophila persimilis TaxID=7234 RepID=B4HCN0_DROPE|nr:GL22379 [Drosophila persimilis]